MARIVRRNGWTIALYVLLACLLVLARALRSGFGPADIQSLAIGVLPIIFAAAAQTVCVISGGIDLSVGPVMAFTSVTAAALMKGGSEESAVAVVIAVLLLGLAVGAINGLLVVASRVPDIIVTLAMSFVWAGAALLVLSSPGGPAAQWFKDLSNGSFLIEWFPKALLLVLVCVAIVWLPLRRSRLGLSMYAVGSNPIAALRSGVNVSRTKIAAYAITGLFAAAGGLALTMVTGIGSPVPGAYTLNGVAAIVLGGVSLAGGRGGMLGPIAAAFVLSLIRVNLVFLGVDPAYSTVIQGVILIIVVMVGGLVALRRSRA
ncbi:MAG: ABC transporter permease [Chloroflexi bacterium]|nr:ABC transporter permease [Chloroflexota bacterium]